MVWGNRDSDFSLRFAAAFSRALRPTMTREDLSKKVINACRNIDILDARVHEWEPYGHLDRYGTSAVVREGELVKAVPDKRIDIGYFSFTSYDGKLANDSSFSYNPWAFSDERLNKFREALRIEGLKPGEFKSGLTPLIPIPLTEEEIGERKRVFDSRVPLYL